MHVHEWKRSKLDDGPYYSMRIRVLYSRVAHNAFMHARAMIFSRTTIYPPSVSPLLVPPPGVCKVDRREKGKESVEIRRNPFSLSFFSKNRCSKPPLYCTLDWARQSLTSVPPYYYLVQCQSSLLHQCTMSSPVLPQGLTKSKQNLFNKVAKFARKNLTT